jgi:16S rRNA (guanine966-N2)-methyltransferase
MSLQSPRTDIRPTMDRVKAAIFSSLFGSITGARVLDLFAGTGALGIEALSRGCASADFVEKNEQATESIDRNLAKTRLKGRVHQTDVFSFLDRLAKPGAFDLIFADPPYLKLPGDRDFDSELLASGSLVRALAPDGLFILEKMPGKKLPAHPAWEIARAKKYGATEVVIFRKTAGEQPGGEIQA